jgi:hypothetical protein
MTWRWITSVGHNNGHDELLWTMNHRLRPSRGPSFIIIYLFYITLASSFVAYVNHRRHGGGLRFIYSCNGHRLVSLV